MIKRFIEGIFDLSWSVKVYFFLLALYVGVTAINYAFPYHEIFFLLQIFFGLIFLFLSGVTVTLILQWILRRHFEIIEFCCLSFLGSLLFFPLLLEIEFFLTGFIYDWFPILNVLSVSIFAVFLLILKKTTLPIVKLRPICSLIHPFTATFLLFIAFIGLLISAFGALPDLDPYKWLFKYAYQFSNQQLDSIERPLFGALTFIGMRLLGLERIFHFYKFIFPFFFAAIALPAWLVARQFKSYLKQFLFMALTFISPVALLYGTTAMPNASMMVIAFYFLYFLIYASVRKDDFYLYAAGIISFLAFFYHPAAILLFTPWLVITLWSKRREILADKKLLVLIFIIILTNLERFKTILNFLGNWLNILYAQFFYNDNLNLLYPASYRNIDRNLMGWPGVDGVIKFYAFHMGPIVGAILLLTLMMFFFKNGRKHFFTYLKEPSLLILASVFALFFTISEILPRFPNLGLLPDRAWIFTGIFSIVFAYILFCYQEKISRYVFFLALLFIIIGMSGALYINSLKQYLITPAQWRSAEWIMENLPKERLFLSSGNKNLLPVHAQSRLIRITQESYCGNSLEFQNTLDQMDTEKFYASMLKESFYPLTNSIEGLVRTSREAYQNASTEVERYMIVEEFAVALNREASGIRPQLDFKPGLPLFVPPRQVRYTRESPLLIEDVYRDNQFNYTLDNKKDKLYVYFSRLHTKNPYGYRPYTISAWGFSGCPNDQPFYFDLHPDKFKRIYNDHEEIIIWEVL